MQYEPRSNDIIIPVMGPTGVGKSTFVNRIAGKVVVKTSGGVESVRTDVKPIVIEAEGLWENPDLQGRRLIMVDTPGFDDTYLSDSQVLQLISEWLRVTYSAKMKLSGIIYLYDISEVRMRGSTRRNISVFEKLCGTGGLRCVVLATTKWERLDDEGLRKANTVGELRRLELAAKFWNEMERNGSKVKKHRSNTAESAWELVRSIIQEKQTYILQIQEELVDSQKKLPNTTASRQLRKLLSETLTTLKSGGDVSEELIRHLRYQINQLKPLFVDRCRENVAGFINNVREAFRKEPLRSHLHDDVEAPSVDDSPPQVVFLLGNNREKEMLLPPYQKDHSQGGNTDRDFMFWRMSLGQDQSLHLLDIPDFPSDPKSDILTKFIQWLQILDEDQKYGIVYFPHAGDPQAASLHAQVLENLTLKGASIRFNENPASSVVDVSSDPTLVPPSSMYDSNNGSAPSLISKTRKINALIPSPTLSLWGPMRERDEQATLLNRTIISPAPAIVHRLDEIRPVSLWVIFQAYWDFVKAEGQ